MKFLKDDELSYLLEAMRADLKKDGKNVIVSWGADEDDTTINEVRDILKNAEMRVDYIRMKSGIISETEYNNMWPMELEYDPYQGYDYLDDDE